MSWKKKVENFYILEDLAREVEKALRHWGVNVIYEYEVAIYSEGIGIKFKFAGDDSFLPSWQVLNELQKLTEADDIFIEMDAVESSWVELFYKFKEEDDAE